MNKKIIVWDLFGGSQNSIYKALKDNHRFEIYTFDITEPTRDKHIKLDLSQPFYKLSDKLDNYPEPDIIVASPMCQSFSLVMNTPKVNGMPERLGWVFDPKLKIYFIRYEKDIEELIKQNLFYKHLKADNIHNRAVLGGCLLINTLEIIRRYTPKLWYIENPQTSLMWNVIETNFGFKGIKNNCCYNNYNENYTMKPTTFLSNIDLELNNKRHKATKTMRNVSPAKNENSLRSSIPNELIQYIFEKFGERFK